MVLLHPGYWKSIPSLVFRGEGRAGRRRDGGAGNGHPLLRLAPSYPDQAPGCPSNTLHYPPVVLKLSPHHRRAILHQGEEKDSTKMSIQTQTCLSPAWKQVTLTQRRGNRIFSFLLASNPRLQKQQLYEIIILTRLSAFRKSSLFLRRKG